MRRRPWLTPTLALPLTQVGPARLAQTRCATGVNPGCVGGKIGGATRALTQSFQHSVNGGLGGNAETLEKVLARRAGAKAVHADEDAVLADHGIPAPAHGG